MKYLIQNTKEFVIAICVVLCVITICVLAVLSGDYLKMAGALVNVVFTLLGLYYNIPTSEENCKATGYMRWLKSIRKGEGVGDGLADEPETDAEEDRLEGDFYE